MPKARNELSWRPGYSLTKKPEKKAARRLKHNGTRINRVWTEQEEKGFENVWWGQIVDNQQAVEPEGLLQSRLCFG